MMQVSACHRICGVTDAETRAENAEAAAADAAMLIHESPGAMLTAR